jgi:hypothetical protein
VAHKAHIGSRSGLYFQRQALIPYLAREFKCRSNAATSTRQYSCVTTSG